MGLRVFESELAIHGDGMARAPRRESGRRASEVPTRSLREPRVGLCVRESELFVRGVGGLGAELGDQEALGVQALAGRACAESRDSRMSDARLSKPRRETTEIVAGAACGK